MSLNTDAVRKHLQAGTLAKLFTQELGWDRHTHSLSIPINGHTFTLTALAEKRGVVVYECPPDAKGHIPDYATRRAIEKEVTKAAFEHLLIFVDRARTAQVWQWVARTPGQPAAYREVRWQQGQTGDALVQKLNTIRIPLDEDEALDLTGAVTKLRDAFDRDRVTKKFFDQFKAEHKQFLDFITGIQAATDQAWYASLMLNRLMFVYFIQKKGFLDGNLDYLRDKLAAVKAKKGTGKFHTFYRVFLMKLFHEGFGKAKPARKIEAELAKLLGEVPYLNGGLFEVHQLEANNPNIDIPDDAFDRLFAFFDKYEWHLDSRPLAVGNEINPDVLGYIFEKYINQKQMGAYYTKEDITDYIGKNTIIPRLFDMARERCEIAFAPGSALWKLLADNPDRYLYPAVRHGVLDKDGKVIPLPPDIEAGIADVAQRGKWNQSAKEPFALPTETWREHVARRQRCLELRRKLAAGEITTVNDLITFNLNIRQFAEDAIAGCEGPELLRAFYEAITSATVLDPTCGSGAFLFAALNILQPLYDACLDRMAAFVADADALGKPSPKTFDDFRDTLKEADAHPSREYFVLKSIAVRNLYGVDIMAEAVEICKLRLFLKLVAQVDRADQLEPLPDIDFNIRPGNTLVGFATLADVRKAWAGTLDFDGEVDAIEKTTTDLARRFKLFRDFQTSLQSGAAKVNVTKDELRVGLADLRFQLDRGLAGLYGIDPDDTAKFDPWRASHQPFHWFAEFHAIMAAGGFDVVIGNPPYVEYAKVKQEYTLIGYGTLKCGNLFATVFERCTVIAGTARIGLIVPLSLVCTDRMATGRELLRGKPTWIASFDMRPASLFEGVAQRLSIVVQDRHSSRPDSVFGGGYRRWTVEERDALLPLTRFTPVSHKSADDSLGKFASQVEPAIRAKIAGPSLGSLSSDESSSILVHRICRYFIKALDFTPKFVGADGTSGKSEDYKPFEFPKPLTKRIVCLLNSNLFYWFWRCYGDGFHCGYGDVYRMPLSESLRASAHDFEPLVVSLMKSFRKHSTEKSIQTKRGQITYQEFAPAESKLIMDDIDRVLAEHYGFTAEELDFILNYDIKYRLGAEENGEDDE